jgi:hypothetical protein
MRCDIRRHSATVDYVEVPGKSRRKSILLRRRPFESAKRWRILGTRRVTRRISTSRDENSGYKGCGESQNPTQQRKSAATRSVLLSRATQRGRPGGDKRRREFHIKPLAAVSATKEA